MRSIILSFILLGFYFLSSAQELNCKVQVVSIQSSKVDPEVFRALESSVTEFMNSTIWTKETFKKEERIDCSVLINITEELSLEKFVAQITIQSSRPIYNTNYQSILLNHVDNDVTFEFTRFEPLDFNENVHLNDLTSILGFYAYLIIGMDYDSYSRKGGDPYFLKAQNVVNTAQSAASSGWKRFDNRRNRYWIMENILNPRYSEMRVAQYTYHLKGMDEFYQKQSRALPMVTQALRAIETVNRENPSSIYITLFVNAKSDEIINLYKGALPPDKAQAVRLMGKLDPAQVDKYEQITN